MILRLREILKERKITIAQFAELSGISQSNLSNYMMGKMSPTLETLNKIADALHIELTGLFKKDEDIEIYAKYEDKIVEIKKEDLIAFIKTRNKNK